jgi:hypothetical protein
VTSAPVTLSAGGYRPFRQLSGPAAWAKRALVLAIVIDVLSIVSGLAEIRLLERAAAGNATGAELLANDERQQLVAVVQLVALALGAVFFLRWFRRAYANLRAFGAATRHSPGWAIGYWFIPILNLFRPKRIADEIWRSSKPDDGERAPQLISLWWAAFIAAGAAGQIGFRIYGGAETIESLRTGAWLFLVSDRPPSPQDCWRWCSSRA